MFIEIILLINITQGILSEKSQFSIAYFNSSFFYRIFLQIIGSLYFYASIGDGRYLHTLDNIPFSIGSQWFKIW